MCLEPGLCNRRGRCKEKCPSLAGLFSSLVSGDYSPALALGLPVLRSMGSLWDTGSVVVGHGLNCSIAYGTCPDQGMNLCPLQRILDHCADSGSVTQPLIESCFGGKNKQTSLLFCLYTSAYASDIRYMVFPTSTNSPAPVGCPTVQFSLMLVGVSTALTG